MIQIKLTARTFFVLLILSPILFFSCGSDDGDDSMTPDTAIEVNLDINLILRLVNEYRSAGATCGTSEKEAVSALAWSDELANAALDHANDMQQNDYFSHTSQDGRTFSQRATSAGFEGSPVGENIANGYRSEDTVMQGWMDSTGHCENIMGDRATHIGIAKSTEGFYWVMVLGRE